MSRPLDTLRARLRSEQDGFTLVELLVAALIAGLAIMAVIGTIDRSGELIGESERYETATQIGEQELERIASMAYADVGTLGVPETSEDPRDARFYVKDGGTTYQWDTTDPARKEALEIGSGTLALNSPWSTPGSDGTNRLEGDIWRFVTRIDDPNLASPGETDAKRVTVAVTVPGRRTKPVTLTSIVWEGEAP